MLTRKVRTLMVCVSLAAAVQGCAVGIDTTQRDVGVHDHDDLAASDAAEEGDVGNEDSRPDLPRPDVPTSMDGGCVADPASECIPGQTRTQSCGACGTQSATCTSSCQWGPWSACTGEGVCMPGQTRTQSCGACGTQSATCTSSCEWGPWSACTGEGACTPGQTRAGSCDPCSYQVCNASCSWGACQLRPGNACEYRGGTNARSCSACSCGRQWCLSSCQWSTACVSCCSTCGGCL